MKDTDAYDRLLDLLYSWQRHLANCIDEAPNGRHAKQYESELAAVWVLFIGIDEADFHDKEDVHDFLVDHVIPLVVNGPRR